MKYLQPKMETVIVYSVEKSLRTYFQMAFETGIETLDLFGTTWDIPKRMGAPFYSLEEAQIWINLLAAKAGEVPDIQVFPSKWANRSEADKGARKIYITDTSTERLPIVLLHELTHMRSLTHGRNFQERYLELLEIEGGSSLAGLTNILLIEERSQRATS